MKHNYLFILIIILLTSGCETLYGPAMTGSNMPYQARSAYHGRDADEIWISGAFNQGIKYAGAAEENFLVQGSFHKSQTREYFKATYGGYVYGGSYRANIAGISDLSFWGLGARGSIVFCLPTERADFNLIGVQGGMGGEFGQYDRFRSSRDIYWGPINPTLNYFSSIDFKLRGGSSLGVEQGFGFTGAPLTVNFTSPQFSLWGQVNLLSIDCYDWRTQGYLIWAFGASFRVN